MTDRDTLGDDLHTLVTNTRRRLRIGWVVTGGAYALIVSVVTLLVAIMLDSLFPMDVPGRVATLTIVNIVIAFAVALGIVRPTVRRVDLDQVALRIERAVGGLHNRLLTLLDLRRRNGRADVSEVMVERVVTQTRDRLRDFRMQQVADPQPVRRTAAMGLVTLVAAVIIVVSVGPRLTTALARIMQPTASIAPVTSTALIAPGDLSTLQGEPLQVTATTQGKPIDTLTLHLRDADGHWHQHGMQRTGDHAFSLRLAGLGTSAQYKLVGGGTWTPVHHIHVARRPVIDSLAMTVTLPSYLGDPTPRPVDLQADRLAIPAGSTLHVTAQVVGEIATGHAHLSRAEVKATGRMLTEETVWFEDDVPGDAEVIGKWQWVTDPVFSGYRAHAPAWQREPYGFDTRLSQLDVPPGASFFVYTNVDPEEPPLRVSIHVASAAGQTQLVWGEPIEQASSNAPPPVSGALMRVVHVGELPSTAQGAGWHRLEVPVERLTNDTQQSAKLNSIRFDVDTGRIWFDRLGYLTRREHVAPTTNLLPAGEVTMTQADDDTWSADVLVDEDLHVALSFTNVHGHANIPMRPVPVSAVPDRAPSVVIDRPAAQVTLGKPAPVPVTLRARDDLGLASVTLQTSTDGSTWSPDVKLAAFTDRPTTHRLTTVVDPTPAALPIGGSLYYRVAARDLKGQVTLSPPHRVTIGSDPSLATGPDATFNELSKRLNELAGTQDDVQRKLEALLASMPDEVKPFAAGKDGLKDKDGNPLTGEAMQAFLKAFDAALDEEQRRRLAELDDVLADQQARANDLAGRAAQAARQMQQSPTAAPMADQALSAIARKLQQLAQQRSQLQSTDMSSLQKMRQLSETGPNGDAADQLDALQKHLAQMLGAQQQLADNPQQVELLMRLLIAQMRGGRAMQEMGGLAEHLVNQHQTLSHLQERVEQLQGRARSADGSALPLISEQESSLDHDALDALAAARHLLRERFMQSPGTPKEPWSIPQPEALPEINPKDPAFKDKTPQEIAAELERRLAAVQPENDPQWWDESDQHGSPREQLQQHQEGMRSALEANAGVSERTTMQLHDQRVRLSSVFSKLQETKVEDADAPQVLRQFEDQMASPQLRQLLAMAQRAERQRGATSAMQPNDSGDAQKGDKTQRTAQPKQDGEARAGVIESMDLTGIDLGDEAARLYRLPPELRRPLLDAMKERGPEAYQPLIDAYFRRLAEQEE